MMFMSNDLAEDRLWLLRLVAAMEELASPCSGRSASERRTRSLLRRLRQPASARVKTEASRHLNAAGASAMTESARLRRV